ncbi:PepSY domain-containing protein [Pseudorhodoferax sp.]|uniref:PepSY domain-containing protein n=1 Tax=Pseudorhodoferax sp. TaxID=1993553 RepID=UPI002DD63151|nr:PepSY domain-containing protein [Pseudorhodoferax sp.]
MIQTIARCLPLVLALAAGSALAQGQYECTKYPKAEWRSATELQNLLVRQGWTVASVESSACYVVTGKDAKGKQVTAYFDPKTLERVDGQ